MSLMISSFVPIICQQDTPEDKFEYFLKNTIEELFTLFQNSNIDPTPSNPQEITFTWGNYNMTLKIKDEQVLGLSGISEEDRSVSAKVNMEQGTIDLSFDTFVPILFQGNYSLTGWTDNRNPITGQGKWSYKIENPIIENLNFVYGITPTGYIVISEPQTLYKLQTPFVNTSVYFQDNSGSENEDEDLNIRTALYTSIYYHFSDGYPGHPIFTLENHYFTTKFLVFKKYLQNFFTRIFAC